MKFQLNDNIGVQVKQFFVESNNDTSLYNYVKNKGLFSGKLGEVYLNLPFNDTKEAFVGLGHEDIVTIDNYREAYCNLLKRLIDNKEYELTISVENIETLKAIVEGLYHATYKFDKYKSNRVELPEIIVNINANFTENEFVDAIKETEDVMDSVFFARNLVNERSEYLYPETLANIVVDSLSPLGIDVEVYDEKQCEEMGLKAFLSVGRASARKPRFIVMKYMNDSESNEVIGFVGKGVTYDTGGYSLKPTSGMTTMHCDMGGAGSVIGAMRLIAKRKLKANVVAVVAACENMISGSSYKPGDVIYSLSGKTIEVDNTDAEGRITLADSVYYATNKLKVSKIIDLATLTGACVVALGEFYTGSVTNNQQFFDELKCAAENAGERVWQMPVDNSYRALNKSSVADVKNTGGRYGGMITAGLFIENFVDNNIPWIHLDIAGTAYLTKPEKYLASGATGIHVKTLFNLLNTKK
ncbi:leucyl aminopeptidase [Gemella sp. GH3]|uniref:leucyl aminopeptidase n=1 Tax=unclassified Gemella TaxID=2624949 RepID=UPI0015D099BA|nr:MULTISPECIES: leucyl aminopeptidase [unclassified Gemella]MBF0713586.1 leucyl aminopeptidase [Gemella sp. GH3.1]NYS50538.1 leucyl aminopeptidase [Gemella sp. GH3]